MADFRSDFITPISTQEEWKLYIDGSSSSPEAGARVLLKSQCDIIAQNAVKLSFEVTNNEAEYETLLSNLRIATLLKARCANVFTDSQLITWKISGSYLAKEPRIQEYLAEVQQKMTDFDDVLVEHIPRVLNAHIDALARLTSATTTKIDHPIIIKVISKPHPPMEIFEILEEDWMRPILQFLTTGLIPEGVKEEHRYCIGDELYKRGYNVPLLCCVDSHIAKEMLEEFHEGTYGTYEGPCTLASGILYYGYYWSRMHQNTKIFISKRDKC